MKRLYQAGDTGSGWCLTCQDRVSTHMKHRTFVPPGTEMSVSNILVEVCDRCEAILTIPPQSAARIHAQVPELAHAVRNDGIQARIPAMFEDALDLVAASVGGSARVVRSAVLRYYIQRVAGSRRLMEAVKLRATDPLAECAATQKITIKVPKHQKTEAMHQAKRCGVGSEAHLIRGMLLLIADDFEIEMRPCNGGSVQVRATVAGASGRRNFIQRMARVVS